MEMNKNNRAIASGILKTFTIAVLLFRFCDLYGQGQSTASLSVEQCLRLADVKQQAGDIRDATYFLNAAAEKVWEAKDYRKAIEYYDRSVELNESIPNWNGIAGINCNIGLIYFDLGEYENSYDYLKKAYTYRKEHNEKYAVVTQLINISVTLNKMERYAESIEALEEAVSVSRDLNNYDLMRSCYGMISETYTKAGNNEKAADYFFQYKAVNDALSNESEKRYKTELTEANMKAQLAEMEKELAETRSRYANYELAEKSKAFEGLDSANRALLESKSKAELMIENLEANKIIAELQQREIEEQLNAEKLKTRNLILFLLASVILVIIVGFFFWHKKRDNQKLAVLNDNLLRTQKELEDYQGKLEELVVVRTSNLMKLLDQVQESDRLKSAFFSNMSHEIRTPLNAILGFLQIVDRQSDNMEENIMLNFVKLNAQQMIRMFDDIVSLSEIDSGVFTNRIHEYNIYEILNNAALLATETTKTYGKEKLEILLNDNIPANLEKVFIDGIKINRILLHLIDNAIKNTDSGYVMFGCETSIEDKTLSFWVEDTGSGIDEEDYELIFKRFWKKGEASTQKSRGLGIGLPLCKEFLERMDGNISFTSKAGYGTTFTFSVKADFS